MSKIVRNEDGTWAMIKLIRREPTWWEKLFRGCDERCTLGNPTVTVTL